ncbi:MAG: LysR family transcriptional regulator [Gordonibacter sp.]|uniref:LysR family transcriptional regulator n=2 Tax=Gordonibacter sp. TaxID=1968902 RepID=UPI002FCB2995
MNLSQLYYFKKLAELQHYAKAAKELYITQPSLSNAISSLEQELGVSLFQKTGRNIHLTKYGSEFLVYVTSGLEQVDKGIAIMKNYAGTSDGGKIDLGCIITVQTGYIPKLLNNYKTRTAGVAFNVREAASAPLLGELKSGHFDVVFCAHGEDDPDIAYIPVLTQQVVVAMGANCPLASKAFITPADLEEQHLISYLDTIPLGRAMRRALDERGVQNVEYNYLDESILAGFAANGVEAAIMLDTFFLHSVEGLEVRPFYLSALERRPCYHRVYLAYSTKNYHPYCVDHFIQYITDNLVLEEDPLARYID